MKIVTLGEIMIRLQPYDHLRFVQTDTLQYTYGGGEANVAVSLANFGADVAFVTKLPAHAIGQAGVNALRRYGVDTMLPSLTSTSTRSSRALTGSTSPASPRPWAPMLSRSAWLPARLLRLTAPRSAAT